MTVVTGVAGSGKSSLITTAFEQNEDAIFINQNLYMHQIVLIYLRIWIF